MALKAKKSIDKYAGGVNFEMEKINEERQNHFMWESRKKPFAKTAPNSNELLKFSHKTSGNFKSIIKNKVEKAKRFGLNVIKRSIKNKNPLSKDLSFIPLSPSRTPFLPHSSPPHQHSLSAPFPSNLPIVPQTATLLAYPTSLQNNHLSLIVAYIRETFVFHKKLIYDTLVYNYNDWKNHAASTSSVSKQIFQFFSDALSYSAALQTVVCHSLAGKTALAGVTERRKSGGGNGDEEFGKGAKNPTSRFNDVSEKEEKGVGERNGSNIRGMLRNGHTKTYFYDFFKLSNGEQIWKTNPPSADNNNNNNNNNKNNNNNRKNKNHNSNKEFSGKIHNHNNKNTNNNKTCNDDNKSTSVFHWLSVSHLSFLMGSPGLGEKDGMFGWSPLAFVRERRINDNENGRDGDEDDEADEKEDKEKIEEKKRGEKRRYKEKNEDDYVNSHKKIEKGLEDDGESNKQSFERAQESNEAWWDAFKPSTPPFHGNLFSVDFNCLPKSLKTSPPLPPPSDLQLHTHFKLEDLKSAAYLKVYLRGFVTTGYVVVFIMSCLPVFFITIVTLSQFKVLLSHILCNVEYREGRAS